MNDDNMTAQQVFLTMGSILAGIVILYVILGGEPTLKALALLSVLGFLLSAVSRILPSTWELILAKFRYWRLTAAARRETNRLRRPSVRESPIWTVPMEPLKATTVEAELEEE